LQPDVAPEKAAAAEKTACQGCGSHCQTDRPGFLLIFKYAEKPGTGIKE
jgi:hypothetical protein